jgi:hypothetical protein
MRFIFTLFTNIMNANLHAPHYIFISGAVRWLIAQIKRICMVTTLKVSLQGQYCGELFGFGDSGIMRHNYSISSLCKGAVFLGEVVVVCCVYAEVDVLGVACTLEAVSSYGHVAAHDA